MKTFYNTIVFAIVISTLSFFSCDFAPGSYPYAERYKVKIKETELINSITKFKENNPDFCLPNRVKLKDGKRDENDLWYHIYFYYKNENIIVKTWVLQDDNENTIFAFVAINEGLRIGNWKLVNKDFNSNENKNQKFLFEQRILNVIKKQIGEIK
jgi:hypothetical protein